MTRVTRNTGAAAAVRKNRPRCEPRFISRAKWHKHFLNRLPQRSSHRFPANYFLVHCFSRMIASAPGALCVSAYILATIAEGWLPYSPASPFWRSCSVHSRKTCFRTGIRRITWPSVYPGASIRVNGTRPAALRNEKCLRETPRLLHRPADQRACGWRSHQRRSHDS